MVHGLYGVFNRNSACIIEEKYSKKFPKKFQSNISSGDDGYPKYRRLLPKEGEQTCTIRNHEIDNRWIVTYNKLLLKVFDGHINVKLCSSVKSIKYVPYLRVCHLNIEGISKDKCEILTKIMTSNNVDVIALQEAHTTDKTNFQKRGYIAGYTLIEAINHKQYGIATYAKNDIDTVSVVYRNHLKDIEILATTIDNVTIINAYKPTNVK